MNSNLIEGKTGVWEIVIGLEIHAQIASKSKLFSESKTEGELGANSRVSFFDAGMPGMLPVINSYCIDQAIKTGLGIHGDINLISIFDRKNYFYPDLPSGYQISQFFHPIVSNGYVDIKDDEETKRVNITRIHIEQDAGKSIHDLSQTKSCIDLNRAGVALMEIVTEPEMRSVSQAVSVAKKIHTLVQYLETCSGNMENGNFRIDANISIHRPDTPFGTRVEIKNLNSFKFMQTALNYEIARHQEVIENGGKINQETRLFDSDTCETSPMRDKENANDYRYFPDPDLPPLILSQERIDKIAKQMPELPDDKKNRFINDLGLGEYDAEILSSDKDVGQFYDEAVCYEPLKNNNQTNKIIANWMIGDLFSLMKKDNKSIKEIKLTPIAISKLVELIFNQVISGKIAKTVFEQMWISECNEPSEIVEKLGLKQISSKEEILQAITEIIKNNQSLYGEYKAGKEALYGFFVGEVMKHFKGKANPDIVNQILKQALNG